MSNEYVDAEAGGVAVLRKHATAHTKGAKKSANIFLKLNLYIVAHLP